MTEDKNKTHLQVGVIGRPHGLRGEVKLHLHFEGSTSLDAVEYVVLEPEKGPAQRLQLESVRGSAKGPILAFVDVAGREGAEALRGAKVWIERAAAPPLEDGEYYLVDLVGCDVSLEGKSIAKVTGVRPDPSVDTMILKLMDGEVAEVPIVEAWVGEVDVNAKTVELLSEDGLIT